MLTAEGLVAAAIVAEIVRVARFAACAAAGTPVIISTFVVIVHDVAAASAAVATVNVTLASF
jgi:hypothetical protein